MASVQSTSKRKPPADWIAQFLAALDEHVTITNAAKAVGISRNLVYTEKQRNEAFALALLEMEESITQRLEREAFRRAAQGVEKAIWHQGKKIGSELQFSDTLLIFLLKARRPEKYRDNVQVEYHGKVEQDITVHDKVVEIVPDEDRRLEVARILAGALQPEHSN